MKIFTKFDPLQVTDWTIQELKKKKKKLIYPFCLWKRSSDSWREQYYYSITNTNKQLQKQSLYL